MGTVHQNSSDRSFLNCFVAFFSHKGEVNFYHVAIALIFMYLLLFHFSHSTLKSFVGLCI